MQRARGFRRVMNVLAAVVLLVAGCGQDTAPRAGSGQTTLRVAMFPAGNTLPVQVAVTDGIFERNGLHVELTEGTDLPVFMAALAKGQYDVVMTNPTLVLIGAEKKIDLQIISSLQRSTRDRPNAVWITRDPQIQTLDQLKGKTIAVPSLTGIIVDAVVYLLARRGVQRTDIRFVQTPFPTMGDQLAAGHVDAAVATVPFSSAIAARGFRVHDDVIVEAVRDASGGSVDVAITTVWASSRGFGAAHPDAVAAWRASLTDAVDALYDDPSRARTTMQQ